MKIGPGTIIETLGCPAMGGFDAVPPERGVICAPRPENLPLPGPGWHIVEFDAGGGGCMHEDSFTVRRER